MVNRNNLAAGMLAGAAIAVFAVPARADGAVAKGSSFDFNRDIRPILSDYCFRCHGPDTAQRKAGLRLDTEKGAFVDLGGYKAIVRGRSAESELWKRITTRDPDDVMPPPKLGKKLKPAEIDLLRRWIDAGAEYQPLWSYIKPKRPELPVVDSPVAHPVDRLLVAKLAREKLSLSPPADRATLIRRLSFDLVGLPPTPAEVDAFAADRDPGAFDKLVDRLLASPHFGERMAMWWLDLVRYADSIGYHSDIERSVSPYRDYVIAAFNDNKPFDRFTIEQLAGDLVPKPTVETKVASTYNMLLLTTEEGGAQAKEYEAKNAADRVRNVTAVWLGATLACAQCHDHKYDPYAAKDFYRMAAFFADLEESAIDTRPAKNRLAVMNDAERRAWRNAEDALERVLWRMDEPSPALQKAQDAWEERTRAELDKTRKSSGGTAQNIVEASSENGTFFETPRRRLRSLGLVPESDTYTLTIAPEETRITGLRVDAFAVERLPNGGLSRGDGNIFVTEVEVDEVASAGAAPVPVKLRSAVADHEQAGHPAAHAIDGNPGTGWAVDGNRFPQDHRLMLVFATPVAGGPGSKLVVRLRQGSKQFPRATMESFELRTTTLAHPEIEGVLAPDLVVALNTDRSERSKDQVLAIRRAFVAISKPALKRQFVQATLARAALLTSIPTTLHAIHMKEPRVVRLLARGNWLDDTGEVMMPGVPAFLGSIDTGKQRATRLDLANWLVARDNPLTARVFVNRLWKAYYGTGLSKILDDLGSQGETPNNQALLDWLAVEFVESGWNIKHMVRLLVTSAAYRQTSTATPDLLAHDPYNRLHGRQSPFRLDAELVRDNALALSGLLSMRVGGRSAKPYQPDGYWDQLNFPTRVWINEHGEPGHRRGLYTHWQRTFLHPSLVAFDAPSREECAAERARSNTPQQALVLLNDPTYAEAARVFAARMLKEGGKTDDDRIGWAFRLATARAPSPAERKVLIDLRGKHLALYRADLGAARSLLAVGDAPAPAGKADLAELASWTSVARAVLNLHETVTRN